VRVLRGVEITAFIPSTDLDRSRQFYGDLLGMEFVEQNGFACVFRAGSTTLRITAVPDFKPQDFTVLDWRVDDIASNMVEMAAAGIAFTHYGMSDQDELGVWTSPSGALIAWFKDPEGNTLSVSQR
jgi:catechol 2,3-dioxygenase-like lactoylglutathione lyase family enzyme